MIAQSDVALRPDRSGTKYFGEEVWYEWQLFNRRLNDDEADAVVSSMIGSYYSGPGRHFAGRPYYRRSRSRTLVLQRCGIDI